MNRLTRYILRQLTLPILFISVALVGVVWLTQSLRFVDLIVNRGLSASHFLYFTVLLLPGILAIILPVALLCGVLYTYHRLSFDSEIIVMKAAGLSQFALAIPAVIMALLITVATYGLTLYLQPLGFRTFKDQQFTIRHNYATVLMREGTFNNIIKGVTVYVRERRRGELLGILVHDNREPDKPVTVMAERGVLVQTPAGPRFVMENGNRQERHRNSNHLSLLYFDRYALDLALIAESPAARWREPGERYIDELLFPGNSEAANHHRDELRAEAHKRFVTPLYSIAFVLMALAAVLSGQFDRRYEWRRILYAAVGAVTVQVIGISLVPVVATTPVLTPLLYLNILLASTGAIWILLTARRRRHSGLDQPAIPEGARMRPPPIFSVYLGRHFISGIATMMGILLGLVFLIDLAELFRRSWGRENVSFLIVIQMAVLRAPFMVQKILPFAALFGGMLAFVRLTRTNQLIVARAAGLSVWQFLFPTIAIALLAGLFVVTLFNPLASATTSLYESLESKHLRGRSSLLAVSRSGLWLRQADETGQSVIHARGVSRHGAELSDVIVFLYDEADRFTGRIDASNATLEEGYWQLSDALRTRPDGPVKREGDYRLPTTLTPEQIQDSFAPPETLSFWSLPGFIETLEKAGFSALRHRLHWHSILAGPLLLCAMVLIAATFSIRLTRRGGAGLLVAGGVFVGFVLYFLSDVVYAIGLSGAVPVILAAWAPAVICALLGLTTLLHLEDG